MDEGDTVHIIFKVVQQDNRTKYDTYKRENISIFDKEELSKPVDANSFRLGYIVGKNQRLTISNSSNLDEVYSLSKDGWIVLWAEPITKKKGKGSTSRVTKRTCSRAFPDDCSDQATETHSVPTSGSLEGVEHSNQHGKKLRIRSGIIQQLKDLKELEETGVLTAEQFKEQKETLLKEMSNL
ncbi:Hypothetical predicted protein [Paramuricea clavata]|uniref:Uncharacterized protein n=1 Tax=Paramuricea clavata TaxID=317549 RepID=A0A6S7HUN3_PARCT|nr:Hypothetical predicted protein [Paramuricea clavata]